MKDCTDATNGGQKIFAVGRINRSHNDGEAEIAAPVADPYQNQVWERNCFEGLFRSRAMKKFYDSLQKFFVTM